MATPKSPFYIVEDFLSPKVCETIADGLGFCTPDSNAEGDAIKMYRFNEVFERAVFERLQPIIPDIMEHFEAEYRGTEGVVFEYIAEGTKAEPVCENSTYIKKKWARTKDRDFTGVLFLSDYSDSPDFDPDYEVYGGKLEFPQHKFGFNPTRGVLVVFPSGPHFINANADVIAGDLIQAKLHIAASLPYLYQPANFPGDYTTWF